MLLGHRREHAEDRRALRPEHSGGRRRGARRRRRGDRHHRALLGLRQERDDPLRQPGQAHRRALRRLLRLGGAQRPGPAGAQPGRGPGLPHRRLRADRGLPPRLRATRGRGAPARGPANLRGPGRRSTGGLARRQIGQPARRPRGADPPPHSALRGAASGARSRRQGHPDAHAGHARRGLADPPSGAGPRPGLHRGQGAAQRRRRRGAAAGRLRSHPGQPGGRGPTPTAPDPRSRRARRARHQPHRLGPRGRGHPGPRRAGRRRAGAAGGAQRDRGPRHGGHALRRRRRRRPFGDRDRRPGRQVHPAQRRAHRRERHEQGLQRGHRLVPRGAGGLL